LAAPPTFASYDFADTGGGSRVAAPNRASRPSNPIRIAANAAPPRTCGAQARACHTSFA